MSRHATEQTGRRRFDLVPARDDLVDAGFVVALLALALIGFRTTYSGWLYLVAGLAGVVLGLVIGHLANVLRQPMIAVAAMTLAVFFLAGGAVALRSKALAGFLPSGASLHGLADESVHGWKELLTTLPPVDGGGPLLVLPYLLGLLGGVGAFCLARRTRPAFAPVAPAFAVLVAVILLGSQTPAARLLQGAVFGVVALAWASLRSVRQRPPLRSGSGRATRAATVAVLLGVSATAAALLGPHVPGVDSHKRVVLRSYVTPPFDVGQYPSPLAAFRRYTKPALDLYDKPLFTVRGLPGSTQLRIATLDDYNGLTWTAANRPAGPGEPPDTFQRVGSVIDDPAPGRPVSFTVTIDNYRDYWLPDVGALTELTFRGPHAAAHADHFRYDLATGTGVVPDELSVGDSYRATAIVAHVPVLRPSDTVSNSGGAVDSALSQLTKASADTWSQKVGPQTTKILNIARYLYEHGKYSDGEKGHEQYLPGAYVNRLQHFLGDIQIVGDDEQYAAAFALMINQLGTPARVVLGARVPGSGTVTLRGKDVHAWVEVQLSDGSWRAIPQDVFMNPNSKPDKEPPVSTPHTTGKIVPPPVHSRPHSSLDDANDAASRNGNGNHHHAVPTGHGFRLPGWVVTTVEWAAPPLLFLLLSALAIVGVKAERRRRRRHRGLPATRLARGWHEVVDHARDLGTVLPSARTRREQARLLAQHDLGELARAADAHIFGEAIPADADAARFWTDVDAARRRMSRSVGRWQRLRASLSLASLRRPAPTEAGA